MEKSNGQIYGFPVGFPFNQSIEIPVLRTFSNLYSDLFGIVQQQPQLNPSNNWFRDVPRLNLA